MKKILLVLAALTMQCHAVADSPYEESVKDLLQDYNYSKDKAVASVVLVRCAALINMTNMVSQVPEQLQIDPNELFVSSIAMRTSNPSREEASSTIAEFKEFSKQYQTWFKTASEEYGNPFDSQELKAEFEICDEAAREFLGK